MALEFSCKDAGAACGWHTTAESKDELLQKVATHLEKKHKVENVSQTLQNYAVTVVKEK